MKSFSVDIEQYMYNIIVTYHENVTSRKCPDTELDI